MTGKYKIEFTHWAESDIDDIVTYIAENDNVTDAVKVYLKLKKRILGLDELADRGRIAPELKRIKVMEYKEIIYNPYRIIYKVENETVFIIAVFDGRREIDDIIFRRVTEL